MRPLTILVNHIQFRQHNDGCGKVSIVKVQLDVTPQLLFDLSPFLLYLLFDRNLHTYITHSKYNGLLKCFHAACFFVKHRTICSQTKLTLTYAFLTACYIFNNALWII